MSDVREITVSSYALGTVDDVSNYLRQNNVPQGDTLEVLNLVINAATKRVEQYCRRPFVARSVTEYYDGKGDRRLFLRKFPVVSLTSADHISYDGTSYNTYSSSDFHIDGEHGVLMFQDGRSWYSGTRNWEIVYTPGWNGIASVPDDVVLAFMKLCADFYREFEHRTDDITSVSIEGQTTFFNQDLMSPKVKALLKPYQIPAGFEGDF